MNTANSLTNKNLKYNGVYNQKKFQFFYYIPINIPFAIIDDILEFDNI